MFLCQDVLTASFWFSSSIFGRRSSKPWFFSWAWQQSESQKKFFYMRSAAVQRCSLRSSEALASWTARFRSRCSASEISASRMAKHGAIWSHWAGAVPQAPPRPSVRFGDVWLPPKLPAMPRGSEDPLITSSTVKAIEKWRESWQTALNNWTSTQSTLQSRTIRSKVLKAETCWDISSTAVFFQQR